jgi:hypothetical protein
MIVALARRMATSSMSVALMASLAPHHLSWNIPKERSSLSAVASNLTPWMISTSFWALRLYAPVTLRLKVPPTSQVTAAVVSVLAPPVIVRSWSPPTFSSCPPDLTVILWVVVVVVFWSPTTSSYRPLSMSSLCFAAIFSLWSDLKR